MHTTSSALPDTSADSKSARTRRRILDAAALTLSRRGYAGTRMSDVAAEADIQPSAIYYYFKSRDELVSEVMWVGTESIVRDVAAWVDALDSSTSPFDRLLGAVEAHLRHELEISDYARATIRNGGLVPKHVRERQSRLLVDYLAFWDRLLNDAVAADQIPSDMNLRDIRMLLLGALNWAAEWWNPNDDLEQLVGSVLRLVESGLRRQ